MPTALESQGDFSQSLNVNGGLRTIYDPYTTSLAADGTVTRTPFAGNKIPASRFDPLSVRVMKDLFLPNRTPDNLSGLNDFADTTTQRWNYWNLSDKVDWFVNDKLRVYGRFSRLETHQDTTANILTKSEAYVPGDSLRNAWTYAGDAIYTISPSTVANFHFTKQGLDDDYWAPTADLTSKGGYSTIWPNNNFYQAYSQPLLPVYFPSFSVGSSVSMGNGRGWYQHPGGYSFSGKVSRQMGSHFVKVGGEFRHSGGISVVGGGLSFNFNANLTANTFLNPNTRLVGDEFATLLLGALNNDSTESIKPNRGVETELYAGFIQDDYKLSRRITLNLGLRYEFDTPWHDPDHNLSVGLDLTQPNQVMQQNPPQLPAAVTALRTAAPVYNGAWVFTDSSHPGTWQSQKTVFMPRIGGAFKIDDRTALRVGWARYVSPSELNSSSQLTARWEM